MEDASFFAARCQRSKPRNREVIGTVDRPDNVLSDEMRQILTLLPATSYPEDTPITNSTTGLVKG